MPLAETGSLWVETWFVSRNASVPFDLGRGSANHCFSRHLALSLQLLTSSDDRLAPILHHLGRVSRAATMVQSPMQHPEKNGPRAAGHRRASCLVMAGPPGWDEGNKKPAGSGWVGVRCWIGKVGQRRAAGVRRSCFVLNRPPRVKPGLDVPAHDGRDHRAQAACAVPPSLLANRSSGTGRSRGAGRRQQQLARCRVR